MYSALGNFLALFIQIGRKEELSSDTSFSAYLPNRCSFLPYTATINLFGTFVRVIERKGMLKVGTTTKKNDFLAGSQ